MKLCKVWNFGMIFVFGWDWGNKYARYSISHEPLKQLSEKGEQKEEFWKTKKMFVQVYVFINQNDLKFILNLEICISYGSQIQVGWGTNKEMNTEYFNYMMYLRLIF